MNSRKFLNFRIFQRILEFQSIPENTHPSLFCHQSNIFFFSYHCCDPLLPLPTCLPISFLVPLQWAFHAIVAMNIVQSKFDYIEPFPLLCAHVHTQRIFFILPIILRINAKNT